MSWYNENDKRVVPWLEALRDCSLVTPGVVDRRSIVEVQYGEVETGAGPRWAHFFAGIGAWDYALRLARWPEEWETWTGSCPCQPWSVAGQGKASMTSATSGPRGGSSSPSGSLQQSLASRLRVELEGRGSRLYALTWKHWAMQSGPPICALRASVRRTFVSASTSAQSELAGWCTPTASSPGGTPEQQLERKRRTLSRGLSVGVAVTNLSIQAQLVGWPTPTRQDASSSARHGYMFKGNPRHDTSGRRPAHDWDSGRWIYCRDSKWRPVEPQFFPLAVSAPSRVVRLRAYGNSIVVPLAAAFVRAFLATLRSQ